MENKKVRIKPAQYSKLEELSKSMGYPMTIIVQMALDAYLKKLGEIKKRKFEE